MINHARTLLVNLPPGRADYVDGGYDGYEHIPANFVPVTLTPRLETLRKVLFGANPDGLFVGLRARELMGYIHQTELAEYVYALDSRVTYWPESQELNAADKQRITISQVYGAPRRVIPVGDLTAAVFSGVAYRSYSVLLTADSAGATAVNVRALETPYTATQTPFTAPTIPQIPLPQSSLKIKIAETSLSTTVQYMVTELNDTLIIESFDGLDVTPIILEGTSAPEAGSFSVIAQWQIATRAKPPAVITSLIPTLEVLGEQVFLELFGAKTVEPYTTFKNLWFDHPLPMYRLAGLTLALIYRTEKLRGTNG